MMVNPVRRFVTSFQSELRVAFVKKQLYRVAPDLGPVPNPLSREYLLLIQQHTRLAFTESIGSLTECSGMMWWNRLTRYICAYMVLKSTTAVVNSLVLENCLMQPSPNSGK